MRRLYGVLVTAIGVVAMAWPQAAGQEAPDKEAFGPAQTAADIVRASANADVALLPAGMMFRDFQGDDLSKLFRFPGDNIVVSKLTGAQLLAALNRAVSLYPSPNSGFLQVSGLEVTFGPDRAASERVVSVTVNGNKLVEAQSYDVAMPISLARGGYGYFNLWDKKAIVRNLDAVTLDSLLKGKKPDQQAPRWKVAN